MICPECESEYREGFTRCGDCDADLVTSLDPEPFRNLAPLYHGGQPNLVTELLALLEGQQVPYVLEAGTALSMLNASSPEIDGPEPWEARIWVPENAIERATTLLRDAQEALKTLTLRENL